MILVYLCQCLGIRNVISHTTSAPIIGRSYQAIEFGSTSDLRLVTMPPDFKKQPPPPQPKPPQASPAKRPTTLQPLTSSVASHQTREPAHRRRARRRNRSGDKDQKNSSVDLAAEDDETSALLIDHPPPPSLCSNLPPPLSPTAGSLISSTSSTSSTATGGEVPSKLSLTGAGSAASTNVRRKRRDSGCCEDSDDSYGFNSDSYEDKNCWQVFQEEENIHCDCFSGLFSRGRRSLCCASASIEGHKADANDRRPSATKNDDEPLDFQLRKIVPPEQNEENKAALITRKNSITSSKSKHPAGDSLTNYYERGEIPVASPMIVDVLEERININQNGVVVNDETVCSRIFCGCLAVITRVTGVKSYFFDIVEFEKLGKEATKKHGI